MRSGRSSPLQDLPQTVGLDGPGAFTRTEFLGVHRSPLFFPSLGDSASGCHACPRWRSPRAWCTFCW